MINCFCCYVIKSAGQIAKKVLLSVISNLLLIEINLSQIRISDSKREKVCAAYPYLLFKFRYKYNSQTVKSGTKSIYRPVPLPLSGG